MQPETRYARTRDGHVAYQVIGDGPLDLVFIPSWANNIDVMWEEPSLARFLRRLASFSRLLCFDKRGTGVSDPVPLAALPTLEEWVDEREGYCVDADATCGDGFCSIGACPGDESCRTSSDAGPGFCGCRP